MRDAEMRACVSGFDIALDAGISWDTNTTLEDADELSSRARDLPAWRLRDAAKALADGLPALATREIDWDDPVAAERDDPPEEIASLLWDLRNECDGRF